MSGIGKKIITRSFILIKRNKMRSLLFVCLFVVICGALAKKSDNKVKIAVYYEALCPDSRRFIVRQLAPVWHEFRGQVKVKLVPYGKSTHDKVDGKWQFKCHHGPNECAANKIHACILKDQKLIDTEKMEMVICLMNQTDQSLSLNTCLTNIGKQNETESVRSCAAGPRGDDLLATYGTKTDAVQRPLSFVPTIVLNEVFNQDNADESMTNLKAAVCRVAVRKPAVCT